MEGFCMLLKRLAYPCRYGDLIYRFGRPVPVFSMATNHVLDYIYNTHNHLITQWNHTLLSPRALEVYAETIHEKGAALENCFGFVDGTVRPIARPDEHQRIMLNGHKRSHALKFQSLNVQNGLIGNLYGPVGKCELCFFCLLDSSLWALPASLYKFILYSNIRLIDFPPVLKKATFSCLQCILVNGPAPFYCKRD